MASFTSFLNRISNWKTLIGLILLYLVFAMVLLRNAEEKINTLAGKEIGPIDVRFGYNPKRTLQMVEEYGEAGRAYYKQVEMSLDILYPIVYAFLFAVLITIIYRRLINGPVRHLNILPFVGMAEIFKLLKWLTFFLIIFLVIYGLIKLLIRR